MRLARAMMVNMGGRPSVWGSIVASQTYRLSGNRGEWSVSASACVSGSMPPGCFGGHGSQQ